MGNYNPSHPAAIGDEWMANRQYIMPVNSAVVLAQQLRSGAAESIDRVQLATISDPAETNPIVTVVDIMPSTNVRGSVSGNLRTSVEYSPTADVTSASDIAAGGAGWERVGGATTNLWDSINDIPAYPAADTDYIGINNGSAPKGYTVQVGSGAFPLTARVLRMTMRVVHSISPSPTYENRQFQYRLYYLSTLTLYTPPNSQFQVNYYGGLVEIDLGEINPQSGRPWSPADVRAFASGGAWALRVEAVGDVDSNPVVYAMSLKVDYLPVDNRVAIGVYSRPAGALANWVDATVYSLSAGAWVANWAKGTLDYVYVWRAARAPMVTQNSALADDLKWYGAGADLEPVEPVAFPPPPGVVAQMVTLDTYGLVQDDWTGEFKRAGSISLRVTGGASWSADSQPYEVSSLSFTSANGPAAQRMRQTSGGTRNYLGVRCLLWPPTTGGTDVTISVWNVGTGLQIGGSVTLTADEVRAMPAVTGQSWRVINANLSAAAPVPTATQVEVRFTVTGSGTWYVASQVANSGPDSRGYGGTTDGARRGGSTFSSTDLAVMLLEQPSPPAGFTGQVVPVDQPVSGCRDCRPKRRDEVLLTWSATALSGGFLRYEIERYNPATGLYELVKQITTEATTSWTDREAPRNRPTVWRIRVLSTAMAFSTWSSFGPLTCTTEANELVFATNAADDLSLVYNYDPDVTAEFPDFDDDVVIPVHGGPGFMVFHDPEPRGVRTSYTLILGVAAALTDDSGFPVLGEAVWAPLLALARSASTGGEIPYVAVLDPYGNVTYAALQLSRGRIREPGRRYTVQCTVVPLTTTPDSL